jgi:hypothetical protein
MGSKTSPKIWLHHMLAEKPRRPKEEPQTRRPEPKRAPDPGSAKACPAKKKKPPPMHVPLKGPQLQEFMRKLEGAVSREGNLQAAPSYASWHFAGANWDVACNQSRAPWMTHVMLRCGMVGCLVLLFTGGHEWPWCNAVGPPVRVCR